MCSGQFKAYLRVDGAECAYIPLSEITFGKIRILPSVLDVKAKLFARPETGIAQPDIEPVFRGIEIGSKRGIGVMNAVGGHIAADREITRQQIIEA
jgi:hypothetical protein